jgi:hypothetical protein
MTAVLRPGDAYYSRPEERRKCMFCGTVAKVPYVEWCSAAGVKVVCSHCARWGDGFAADLRRVRDFVLARQPFRMDTISEVRQ